MVNWWNRRKRRKEIWRIAKAVDRYMRKHEGDALIKSIPRLDSYTWLISYWKIKRSRMVRGDLVEVFYYSKRVLAYADQSHQYSGFIGIHDIEIADLELARHFLAEVA